VSRSIIIVVLLLGLAACNAPPPRPVASRPPVPTPNQPSATIAAPAGTYKIDPINSQLRLLVYRAGPLASLGHNHVMQNHDLSGYVELAPMLSDSTFSLSVPVDKFVIDDAQARQEEGSDFPGEIPADAKSGTREHMLSPAVLNAAQFPLLTVQSMSLFGTPDALSVVAKITVRGRETTLTVPSVLRIEASKLTVSGSFELRQTELGITPYSLMLGALQVADTMRVKFIIVAVRR
jgi:polyisoprenoid-binding protein YceI